MWQEKAACQGEDPILFYPEDYRAIIIGRDPADTNPYWGRATDGLSEREIQDTRDRYLAAAKAICAVCPVQAECLKEGETMLDWFGIRAGLDGDQRKTRYRNGKRRRPPGSYKRVVSPVTLHGPGEASIGFYIKGCPCLECKEHNRQKGVRRRLRQRERERVSA